MAAQPKIPVYAEDCTKIVAYVQQSTKALVKGGRNNVVLLLDTSGKEIGYIAVAGNEAGLKLPDHEWHAVILPAGITTQQQCMEQAQNAARQYARILAEKPGVTPQGLGRGAELMILYPELYAMATAEDLNCERRFTEAEKATALESLQKKRQRN